MSDAPALPAQTPGTFVGGGGSGTSLTGDCAAAAADCGLSALDFAPFEQAIAVVRAAHERCADYDDARWLEERERELTVRDTEAQRESAPESRLRRVPSSRERRLALCVAAPIVHPSFYQSRAGDSRTNVTPGYDAQLAPAAPHLRGLCMRTAAHHAFRASDPALPRSGAIDSDTMKRYRQARVREILTDAADEDAPRLRSTSLASSTRPRQAESERRALEQTLPAPPQLASAVAPSAEGAEVSADRSDDDPTSSVKRRAEGCVGGTADAQERAMQREIRDSYGDDYPETQRRAQERERGTQRERDRRAIGWESADDRVQDAPEDRGEADRARVDERRAAVALARASTDHEASRNTVAAMPALRLQAIELGAGQMQMGELEGHMPNENAEYAAQGGERAVSRDG
jgi:hypothetical protein